MQWENKPSGKRNVGSEIECGQDGPFEFSLCHRAPGDEEFKYRLFVYCSEKLKGGWRHLGGFNDLEAARKVAGEFRSTPLAKATEECGDCWAVDEWMKQQQPQQ